MLGSWRGEGCACRSLVAAIGHRNRLVGDHVVACLRLAPMRSSPGSNDQHEHDNQPSIVRPAHREAVCPSVPGLDLSVSLGYGYRV
jgi:hypothetical protein